MIDIDEYYPLTSTQLESYRQNGFIKLKNVLSPQTLAYFNSEFTRKVFDLNTLYLSMEERTTYQKAFLQVMNLWQHSPIIRQFVFGQKLARIAAELLGVSGVRLYHDQALYKESGGGITPWHADQYYWPLSSDKCVTVWIPLQETTLEMGPLAFSMGSHQLEIGRNLAIGDESEAYLQQALVKAELPELETPFDLGEVSFHSGWTFHHAGANVTDKCREVMTIIYMDKDMKLAAPTNENQLADWRQWCPGVEIGNLIDSPLNPILYQQA